MTTRAKSLLKTSKMMKDDDDGDNLEAVIHVMGVSARLGHRHNGDHLKLNSEADDEDDDDGHESSSGV